jgi:tetratricopeptide (TPR) repeat protein
MRPRLLDLLTVLAMLGGHQMADAERPSVITESLSLSDDNPYRAQKQEWRKVLLQLGVQASESHYEGWSSSNCLYENALSVIHSLDEGTPETKSYKKRWAENQERVFTGCAARSSGAHPPLKPEGKDLPVRATTDFLYQHASWHFYQGHFDKALELYREVFSVSNAPMRPYAGYMILRSLQELRREDEAYSAIDTFLADPSLRSAHALIANYRFILG